MRNSPSNKWIAVISWVVLVTPSFAYLTDGASHPAPQYDTYLPPAKGGSYVDPVFGTAVRRLSAALSTNDNLEGGQLTWILNEYSTIAAFNEGATRFLLQHDSYFALYDQNGTYLRDMPYEIAASSEPRWSRKDPNVVYYFYGNQIRAYNTAVNQVSVVRTFSEYGQISGHGEADICFDGNHMVVTGDDREIFVYEFGTNSKGPVLDVSSHPFDAVYITPNDNVTVTWYEPGTGRYNGIELFNRNMVFQRQLTHAGGHMDVTRDTNGEEVLLWTNSADPYPIADCDNGIVKVRLSDGHQTCLQPLDWDLAVHVSAPDQKGFVLVSTYAPGDPDPNGNWPAYTNELFQVMLDGSPTRRLAHHRSRPFNDYNWLPKATISRDGRQVIYASNFGLQAKQGAPAEYSDAYLLNLGNRVGRLVVAGLGPGASNPNRVGGIATDGSGLVLDFYAYGATWGTNVAGGQLDASANEEILTAPGPGYSLGPQIRAFDQEGQPLGPVNFYASGTLRYGSNVGAGDTAADGRDEILSGAGTGAVFGPHIRGFQVAGNTTPLPGMSFFAYSTLKYGARVSGGDVDGDGRTEALTAPGPGPSFGPNVRGFAYDGARISTVDGLSFYAFGPAQYGASVASGNLDQDGSDEMIVSPGPGPALSSQFSGFKLDGGVAALPGYSVTPFSTGYGGRPAAADLGSEGAGEELLAGAGPSPAASSAIVSYSWSGSSLQSFGSDLPFGGTGYGAVPATVDAP